MPENANTENEGHETESSSLIGRVFYRTLDRLGIKRSTGLLGWVRSFEFTSKLLEDADETSRQSVNALLHLKLPAYIEKPLLNIGRVAPIFKLFAASLYLFHELATIATDKTWQQNFRSASPLGKIGWLTELGLSMILIGVAIAGFCALGSIAVAIFSIVDGVIGIRDAIKERSEANETIQALSTLKTAQQTLEHNDLLKLLGTTQLNKAIQENILLKENDKYTISNKTAFEKCIDNRIETLQGYKKQAWVNGSLSFVAFGTGVLLLAFPVAVKTIAAATYLLGLAYISVLGLAAIGSAGISAGRRVINWVSSYLYGDKTSEHGLSSEHSLDSTQSLSSENSTSPEEDPKSQVRSQSMSETRTTAVATTLKRRKSEPNLSSTRLHSTSNAGQHNSKSEQISEPKHQGNHSWDEQHVGPTENQTRKNGPDETEDVNPRTAQSLFNLSTSRDTLFSNLGEKQRTQSLSDRPNTDNRPSFGA